MAYTYLVGWKSANLYYYGVRFAAGCRPEDLWVKYFTSSKKVKALRKRIGEPDVVEVRKIFEDEQSARNWEAKVIKRVNAVKSDRWLNQSDNTDKFYHSGPRGSFSADHRAKLSAARKGRKLTEAHKQALITSRLGKKNSTEHNEKLKVWNTGRKMSDEARAKMRIKKTMMLPERLSEIGRAAGLASAQRRQLSL